MRRPIKAVNRRHMDYLRRAGLKTGAAYETRLYKLRDAEIVRCLDMCKGYNTGAWPDIFEAAFDEPYLYDWMTGLYLATGTPQAEAVTRDLTRAKAAGDVGNGSIWKASILNYAENRAGENIVSMSGTLRDSFIEFMRDTIDKSAGMAMEKLTRILHKEFAADTLLWQCRRIARTETMISLGKAGDMAAESLGIRYTKQWCISGTGNTRETHEAMDGVTIGQDEMFELPDCVMRYPHDSESGAPAAEIINCACACIREPI